MDITGLRARATLDRLGPQNLCTSGEAEKDLEDLLRLS